jgi:hypothetical protein
VRRWTVLAVVALLLLAACDDGEQSVHVIGDSITGQARAALIVQMNTRGWDTTVDHVGGTRIAPDKPYEVVWRLRTKKLFKYGIPEVLIVGLGTNDCLARSLDLGDAVDRLMAVARPVDHVYWVNSPTVNCSELDVALQEAQRRHDDLTVVDAAAHFAPYRDQWVADDGVHLTESGIDEFARFVAGEVSQAEK